MEALAGTHPARHRQAEWLDVPGPRSQGRPFLGAAAADLRRAGDSPA